MDTLAIIVLASAVVAAFANLAACFGADSRDGFGPDAAAWA